MKYGSSNEGFTLLVMQVLVIAFTLFFKPFCTSIGIKDRLQNMNELFQIWSCNEIQ